MPQEGIFAEGLPHNHFLEYRVKDGADDHDLRQAVAVNLSQSLADGQYLVVGFGDDLWRRLAPQKVPTGLRPFEPLGEPGGAHAPATQRDLWIWLQATAQDQNFDAALAIHRRFETVAELELEQTGFKYHGERDLIDFVDGTGNPKDQAAKEDAALIPEAGGGAFLMTQKWVHDLPKFNALPVSEQEGIVGRTKVEDIELEGEAMPPDSHVSRTDVSEDGVGLKIYRRSSPYGTVTEHGLYFVAFACDLHRFDVQLRRMYGLAGDGLSDRLIEFSQALTGAYWYAPSREELQAAFGQAKDR
jgi:putative iron-dependent peroxidase